MSKKRSLLWSLVGVSALAAVLWTSTGIERASADLPLGAELASIGTLEFGPDGTLFAGDSKGAAVYAFELPAEAPAEAAEFAVADLDDKIAALLGTGPRDVFVKDLAVHPTSGAAYLSVMRGSGPDASPALLRVRGDGAVDHLELAELAYSRLALEDAPGAPQPGARRDPRTLTITDLEMIDGELFIAGLSNEEFASVLRRAPYPFSGTASATGLEIYHGAHGKFETHAPIYTFMPFEIGGKTHLLAGYLCTPLVTFPLDAVREGKKVRGKTVAELGFGNVPLDMFSYERGGEEFVVMTNTRRGAMRMRAADIRAAQEQEGITSEVRDVVAGVEYVGAPLGHVVQIADYDEQSVLILGREAENGSLSLRSRSKRWL